MKTTPLFLANIAALLLLCGCASTRPLKPGVATIKSSAPQTGAQFLSELKQPENPAQGAAQSFERTVEAELPLPAGTTIQEKITTTPASAPATVDGAPAAVQTPVTTEKVIVLSQPVVQKTRTTEKAGTEIGAAQRDAARELGAKLSSLKGVVWVGVVLFLFGIATLSYPPLRLLIGSVTTSVAIMGGGLALIVLPTMVVGHEGQILGIVGAVIGVWFLGHRHGQLRGQSVPEVKRKR